jgi:uncharacterized protein YndB with AHSA1/START domain
MDSKTTTRADGRELLLTRVIDAPRERVYQAWTDPELIRRWFAPAPYTTPRAEMDVRPGGANLIVMQGPDGTEIPCPGVYLEVVPNERMVLELTFGDLGGRTQYTARIRHWSVEDREAHEKMGFHEGWKICTEQLAALVEGR